MATDAAMKLSPPSSCGRASLRSSAGRAANLRRENRKLKIDLLSRAGGKLWVWVWVWSPSGARTDLSLDLKPHRLVI